MKSLSKSRQKNNTLKIKRYYLIVGMFYLIVISCNFFAIPKYSLLILSFFTVAFIILKKKEYIYIVTSMLPFSAGVPYPKILLIGLLIYIFKSYRNIKLTADIIIIIFILFWELIHLLDTTYIFNDYITFAIIMIWFGIIHYDKKGLRNISKKPLIYIFSLSTIILGMILIYQSITATSLYYFLNKSIRLGSLDLSNSIFSVNPNTIALYSICSIAMILSFKELRKRFKFNILLLTMLLIIGLLTYSRMFIISLFVVLSLFLIYYKNIRKMLFVIVLSILFLSFVNNMFPEIGDNIFARFDVEDISNGRTAIAQEYNEYLSSNTLSLLFGVGIQNYQNKTGISESVHNPFQEVIVIWGVFGLVLVFYLLFSSLKSITKEKEDDGFISYLPLIAFAISIQTSRIFTTPINIIVMSTIFISIKGEFYDKKSV